MAISPMATNTVRTLAFVSIFGLMTGCGGGGGNSGGGGASSSVSSAVPVSSSSSSVAVDTTPDSFSFTALTDKDISAELPSNPVTITGINATTAISITGGQYSIGGGAYTASAGTITNGQTVTVKLTSSAQFSTATKATLTVGGVSADFNVTTKAPNTTPDTGFFFINPTEPVALSSPQALNKITSNEVTINGIDIPVAISIVEGEYSIEGVNGGAFTAAAGTVSKGQKVKVRVVASSEPETATTAILTVGSTPASFKVTTVADTTAPTADILFPPPVSMTEGTSIVVRGTAADDIGVASVKVNGLDVTPKAAGDFSKWQIDLTLTAKLDNNVTVEVKDAKGNTTTQSVMVRQTDDLRNAFPDNGGDGFKDIWLGEIIDKTSNRMLIIDRDGLAIFSVDLSTGKRTKFADLSSFSDVAHFGGLVLNPNTQRIYFAADTDLYDMPLVNNTNAPLVPARVASYLTTDGDLLGDQLIWNEKTQKLVIIENNYYLYPGSKAVLAPKFIEFDGSFVAKTITSADVLPIRIKGAVFDKDTGIYYLLVTDNSHKRAIYTLNPITGIATLFSDFSIINRNVDRSFILDKSHNRLLVVEDGGAINGVDLTSGKLTQVSDNLSVNYVDYTLRLIVDSRQSYAYLSENRSGPKSGSTSALYAMDLETGHRVVFSKPDNH